GLPPGDYVVVADRRVMTPRPGETMYAPTFYPGTRDETSAGRLVLGTGQETTVTFAAEPVARVATISGFPRSSDGAALAQLIVGLLGPRRFVVSGLPSGWWLKSITVDGRDVTDTPIDFNDRRRIDDAEVVLTRTHTEVVGDVVNQRNAAVTDYTIVVFPERRDQ